MSWRGVPRNLAAAILLLLALVGFGSPSHAQGEQYMSSGMLLNRAQAAATGATATASTLIDISVVDDTATQAHVLLTFAPHAAGFSLTKAEGDHLAIAFLLSSRGSSARYSPNSKGLVRSIDFDQQGADLVVRLGTSVPVTMTAATAGDQVVRLNLTTGHSGGPGTLSVGTLPKAEERPPGQDGFEVVQLKYADVSEVVGLLTDGLTVKSNDVFIPSEPAFGSAGVGGTPTNPSPPANPAALDQPLAQGVDAAISVDRRLNAIILKGAPDAIARLKEKIAQIDVPVQSVILETMFVELDESGATNVGLNFNNSSSQIGVATFQTGSFVASGSTSEKPLTSVSLQAAIYAQVMKGHGRIVSKPRISAQSGSTAKIITGDALPILTSIALSGVNAVSQQVQYVNVGVTLQIAPRVSSNGFVTSHVFCVVSSVTGTSQGYPTISQREAETSATVRDGETFVIGGLTEESELVTDSKIPGLGDIPLLGRAFRVRNGTSSKTDLYIVVTPTIIKRGDLGLASAAGSSAAQFVPSQSTSDPAPSLPVVPSTVVAPPSVVVPPSVVAPPSVVVPPSVVAPPSVAAPTEPLAATAAPGSDSVATVSGPAVEQAEPPAVSGGGVSVQIGAFAASSLAQAALGEAAEALPGPMANKSRNIEAASKGGKRFYRASIGGFASKTEAEGFCAQLKTLGTPCFVANRRDHRTARDLKMRPAISIPTG